MSEEKKIYVDEDWKAQVEAEKESTKQEASEAPSPGTAGAGGLPPASYPMMLTTFATEAMMAMGQIPNPATQQAEVNLEHARYAIDMLEVLREKTKGNLTTEEETMQRDLLHQLRMAFIATQSQAEGAPQGTTPPRPAGEGGESPIIT